MFFTKKTPKSGTARLEQEMANIADQAMANAQSLRAWRALAPITHGETPALFTEINKAGDTVYNLYHFTEDMNQIDPEAQIHLMQFFGQILTFNELLEHPGVESRLDWILANAGFFERFFARAELSNGFLTGKPENDLVNTLNQVQAADTARFEQLLPHLFAHSGLDDMVPRKTIPLMVAMGKPHEEGQKFINGVYFSAQTAPAVMNWLASLQAKSPQDQNNDPAHA